MGEDVADFEPGGGESKGSRSLLQGGSPVGVAVQGGDVGPDPQDGAGTEHLSAQFAQRITRRQPRRRGCGSWDYPMLVVDMAEAGSKEIGTYVTRRHNTYSRAVYCEVTDSGPL